MSVLGLYFAGGVKSTGISLTASCKETLAISNKPSESPGQDEHGIVVRLLGVECPGPLLGSRRVKLTSSGSFVKGQGGGGLALSSAIRMILLRCLRLRSSFVSVFLSIFERLLPVLARPYR